jgi:hypothetical protein
MSIEKKIGFATIAIYMSYKKRYEDSYLDEEDEDFEGSASMSDTDKLVHLILKKQPTDKEIRLIEKLTMRLVNGAKMPGALGESAVNGLGLATEAYNAEGRLEEASRIWAMLLDVAETTGNRDLYYRASDGLANTA